MNTNGNSSTQRLLMNFTADLSLTRTPGADVPTFYETLIRMEICGICNFQGHESGLDGQNGRANGIGSLP